jgi:eukaryotic-like serine/threonine-protein kinase
MVPPGMLPGGRYRLDAHIASGGMGEVWRGTDVLLQRQVAVKLLRDEYAREPEASARFRAEARHAGALSHPNIAQIFDFSDDAEAGQPYLVMELVDGPSLATLLADGPVGPEYAMAVTAQVSAGLAAAHEAGLIHRDIKPANLLISKDGLVKITDFGIAHAAGAAPVTRTGDIVGTVAYLAPERATGSLAGPPSDLYALGIVAYECLTGERPFSGDALAVVIAHQERALPPLPPDVPPGIAALVTDLTAKDPAARLAGATEVAGLAERLRADVAGTTPVRPGLPVISGSIVNTGPQSAQPIYAAALPSADEAAQREPTRPVAAVPQAAGDDGGADGEPGRRRLGPRALAGMAAAVIVLAGLAAWVIIGLGGDTTHARVTGRTGPTARPTTHSSQSPTGGTELDTAPAVAPATQPANPAPSPSATPTQSAKPTQTQTQTQAPTPPATQSSPPTTAPTSPAPQPSSPSG